jgi:diadenosine tetraphosphate (Ap4A) HIT family hydrolase
VSPDDVADGACHVCEQNAAVSNLPFRERLYLDADWRISHAWSALPGWLVVAPRRHVESLVELTSTEARDFGELLRAVSAAVADVVGCRRTYVVLFAEQPRYHHLHVHVVPRMDWFTEGDLGPEVFRYLRVPEDEQVPVEERERLAAAIAARLDQGNVSA